MGIIEFHVHDGLSFEADFGGESSDDVGIAPADTETASGDDGDESGARCGCGKSKALGLLVVLGFLAVTGLLVKRTLGGDDDAAEITD
ncbi:hypothetical protein MBEHAL_0183 [Halarchaeum acidiphilum MH1-52-1]|uniref:Uncharacterized protein n=1 Tax=Halarchaeum acidiphilum MH1-52-1 TaxID=1261545 RepID=U3A9I7_9EURY|nr:hypothetical protein [Halarchaeum acidiphilum]GAD51423.1 hypothetical protein MBEHAL_0183 [Halarchaeum acidiphilum MH1-52-1]